MTLGIICEYNPLHLGHLRQLRLAKDSFGPDTAIVCTMSGNFVQRGEPAIFDKTIRARAALECGADLVVELPLTAALSSAEGFAAGGVAALSPLCDALCFGAENPDPEAFLATARALLDPGFSPILKEKLSSGISFPAARQQALEALGCDASLLESPNNILGVEYTKALLSQGSTMTIHPIFRPGSYHAKLPDPENPSATSLRRQLLTGGHWQSYVPESCRELFSQTAVHSLAAGERAILYRLRTMTDAEFEALPFGSEGLWRKLMHESRRQCSLEAILTAVKSKRYTRTRLNRMVLCAFLGITQAHMELAPPPIQILAFNDTGRRLLSAAKGQASYRNPGQTLEHPLCRLEEQAGSLYGLFAQDLPEAPGAEHARRVFYKKA